VQLDSETKARLLASMHAGRLVVICGAGLSMAAPSSLPPAWSVAEASFDKYRATTDPTCDVAMRHNLEAFEQPGRRYTIDADRRGIAGVVAKLDIAPMAIGVLRGAIDQQAVG
jgi:transcriptional regulator GlxA family with amidase domain